MDFIVARRSIRKFYLQALILVLLCLGLVCLIIYCIADATHAGDNGPREYFGAFLFTIMFIVFSVFSYRFSRIAPAIRVDKDKVSFNKQTFFWKDLDHIEYTGEIKSGFSPLRSQEGATLTFKNGTEKYIADAMYTNTAEVKLFIQQATNGAINNTVIKSTPVSKNEIKGERFEAFKGSILMTYRSALFAFMLSILFLMLNNFSLPSDTGSFFALGFFIFLWWLAVKWSANYFKVSPGFIVVRNHLSFRRKIYRFSDIKEVSLESNGRMPDSLRIITNDFKNKVFYCSSLRNKTEDRLKATLASYGVNVRA